MKRLCVYCGSSLGNTTIYRQAAETLGHLLATKNIALVYGGGNVGLMGAIADATLAAGGEVIGVIPHSLIDRELAHPNLTQLIAVETMHARKQTMMDLSDAFIAMPGGIGTLEELFEVFTWRQLTFHHKPLGLLNVDGYFDGLLHFLGTMVKSGFIHSHHHSLLHVDSRPDLLVSKLEQDSITQ